MSIREEIIEIIKDIGFLTGSRKFGTQTEDSDWDYVILFTDFKKHLKRKNISIQFNNPNTEQNIPKCFKTDIDTYGKERYFRSYRISTKTKTYNILMVWQETELKIWKRTTRIMRIFPNYMIKDKKNRVKLFQCIKEIQRDRLITKHKMDSI